MAAYNDIINISEGGLSKKLRQNIEIPQNDVARCWLMMSKGSGGNEREDGIEGGRW